MLLDLLAAFAAGVLTGAGMGGGTLLLLYLVQVRQMEQLAAQGLGLLYYAAAAGPSLWLHLRHGLVEKKGGMIALCWGIPSCAAGAILARQLDPQWLRRLFGLWMAAAGAWQLLFGKKRKG